MNDAGQNGAAAIGDAGCDTTSTALMISSAPTLIAVLQFWTSALPRAAHVDRGDDGEQGDCGQLLAEWAERDELLEIEVEATASVAAEPVAMTRKKVQP